MKSVIFKEFSQAQSSQNTSALMSFGKTLFLLKSSDEESKQSGVAFKKYQIVKKQNFESKVRFDFSENKNALLTIDDQSKFLRLSALDKFMVLPQEAPLPVSAQS